MKQIVAIFLLSLIMISACKKDEDDNNTFQVRYEVENFMTVNSNIKITYLKNGNTNVVNSALFPSQKWQLSYEGNSGETAYLEGMVVNDSANFDIRIFVNQELFLDYTGYCQNVCDTVDVLVSGTLN